MKLNYEYSKKDFKKYLLKSRIINNIILFIIGIVIYLCFFNTDLHCFPLFVLCLIFAIFLINIIYVNLYIKANEMLNYNTYGKYTLELTPNKFSLTVNKSKTDYKYSDIKKIIVRKKSFIVKLMKNREYLTFEKKYFNDDEYKKVLEYFKNKVD